MTYPFIDKMFGSFYEQTSPPGMTYGVVERGELVSTGAFGVSSIQSGKAVDVGTVFRIASMTKSFAAAAILMLRDRGRLRLEQSVRTFLPDLPDDSLWNATTLFHLLTMQAGFPTDDPWADRQLWSDDEGFSEIFRSELLRVAPPGAEYHYSNLGYMLLGRVISRASGRQALAFISEEILAPLGMTNTMWDFSGVQNDVAVGYARRGDVLVPEREARVTGDGAVFGGLASTLNDLARWIGFLTGTRQKAGPGEVVLSWESRQELQKAVVLVPPMAKTEEYTGYACGLCRYSGYKQWAVGHSGGLPGFGSHMRWFGDGSGIIGLSNMTYCPVWEPCRTALGILARDVTAGVPLMLAIVQGRAQDLISLIRTWDDDVADRLFASNFFQDCDRDDVQANLARVAFLMHDPEVRAGRGLSGTLMSGQRALLSFTLAPAEEGRIQAVSFVSG
ncbi:MAG: serine hydrolase domain-containing protein [Chlamydiia bacterium]